MIISKGTCAKILLVALFAAAVQQIWRLLIQYSIFSHHYKHHPGPCKKVENMQLGSEGFHTLPSGLTFITSGFRMQHANPSIEQHFRRHKIKGRIYLFDFKKADAGVKELKITSTPDFNLDTFRPHGISVWEDKTAGRHVVFVVNHPLEEPVADRIEKFVFDPQKQQLQHQTYYSGSAFKTLNDVQATGENSFYFTNYIHFRNPTAVLVETFLQLRLTNVVHFDGRDYTVVADMFSPNGIAMSADGRFVYVASIWAQEIHVFQRNVDSSLTLKQVLPVHSFPDNIQIDHTTGDLYVGCHPIRYKFMQYKADVGGKIAPSQVIQLRVKDGNITLAQELFYDHGDLISASATAMVYDRKLLIGSVFDTLVLCDVNVPL